MRIRSIQFEPVRIILAEPIEVSFGSFAESTSIIVKITTDDGLTGYGEAAPFAPVTGETTQSVIGAIKLMTPQLINMDAADIAGIHAVMDSILAHNTAAKCAVDIALHDIAGKAASKPLYKLLNGTDNHVINNMTIGIDSPGKMVDTAIRHVNDGFRVLKIKTGIDFNADIRTVSMIREAVGNDIRIRIDANQGYTVEQAVRVAEALAPVGVDAMEQCCASWDLEGIAEVRARTRHTGMKIMLDESLHCIHDAERACKLGAADAFNIKLMKCGGIYPAVLISDFAQKHGLECMIGCMFETMLGLSAGIGLIAAKEYITDADCDSFLLTKETDMKMKGGSHFERGTFTLPETPGIGVTPDF